MATAIRKATNRKVPWSWEDAARAALRAAAAVTEQGEQRHEPTKEELDAAITAYKRSAHIHPGRTHMLAALRAAAAVTEQGENR
ncbi:hypothetical protein J2Y69_002110 [Microbacterium resistens]|uniref:Centromere-binding protein ParB C-terminal domain-containing protein n=1 Tax=Microbacterium resistens TaxID=156977 RepID=A0ABU1SD19_9MICO|nr:hypothetical protein [Microbacterium resistens]